MLFVPGTHARAMEKVREIPADAFVFDLQDAVLPDRKPSARDAVRARLDTVEDGADRPAREWAVRVNHPDSPWGAGDVEALADAPRLDGVLVPRVESAKELRYVEAMLDRCGAPDGLRLMAMIETPLGVLEARAIAEATPRLSALVVGTNDLLAELGARSTPGRSSLLTALSMILLAGRAAGVDVIDGVFQDLEDRGGLEAECGQGRALGFVGKTLIHPKQIDAAHRAFSPSEDEIAEARAVLDGFRAAEARGEGVAVVDGRMVEILHARAAERTLALAERIAGRG